MIRPLLWDSDFLSLKVGFFEKQDGKFFFNEEVDKYNLIYLFSHEKPELPDSFLRKFDAELVDEKLTYQKKIASEIKPVAGLISIPAEYIPDIHFEQLAIQSGIYSRFNVDKKYPDEKFREMYRLWLKRSIDRTLAHEVLIYRHEQKVAGFITIKLKDDYAEIGLVAVDSQFRGQGIGKKLLAGVEYFASQREGVNEIIVVTQATNKPACGLYEKAGYTLKSHQYVYHCWKH